MMTDENGRGSGSTRAEVPSTPSTGSRAIGTALRRLVHQAPLSLAGILVLWLLALGTHSLPSGPPPHLAQAGLFDPSTLRDDPLSPLLSLAWAPDLASYIAATAALLVLGVLAETRLGSRRFAIVLVLSHVIALLGATVVGTAIAPLFPLWAADFSSTALGGPAFGVLGATLACTILMGPLWRRRLRIGGILLPLTLVLYNGALASVALLLAALAGLAVGAVLLGHRSRRPAAPSIRESRVLVALVCAAAAVGPALAALAPHAVGPFSILGVLFTSYDAVTPDLVREVCTPDALVHDCALVQLQARAGIGGIVMSCLPTVFLLVLADGLRRGRRFAWVGTIVVQLGLSLLSVDTFLALLRSDDDDLRFLLGGGRPDQVVLGLILPALQPVAIVLLLVIARRLFLLRASRGVYGAIVLRSVVALVLAMATYVGVGMALAGQFSPRATVPLLLADFPERLLPVAATLRIYPAFLPVESGAIVLYEWIGIAFWTVVAVLLLQSFRSVQRTEDEDDRSRARTIAMTHGAGSMTWMGLWPGNSYWFNDTSYVPYRVLSGVALTLAGPVGPAAQERRALEEFSQYCLTQGWTPCFYSVPDRITDALAASGYRRLQVAEETVLDLGALAFTGKKFQDIRTALNQARKNGMKNEWVDTSHLPLVLLDQIRSISEEWVSDKALPEMGFTLGGLEELRDPAVRCSVIVDDERTVHAVASWLPIYSDGQVTGWTLDFMRRRGSGFKHSVEVLIAQAALDFQAEGFTELSLSGAPLARSGPKGPGEQVEDGLDRILGWVGRALEPVYGFRSLFAFKSKFGPRYVPLYLCYQDPTTLPAIGQAITRAYAPDVNSMAIWRILTSGPRTRRVTRQKAAPAATQMSRAEQEVR